MRTFVCQYCGVSFTTTGGPPAKTCKAVSCQRRYWREHMAARRAADPEKDNARVKAWYHANPERWKALQDRWRLTPCVKCGTPHRSSGKDKRFVSLCQKCYGESIRQRVMVACHYCGGEVERQLSKVSPKPTCEDCGGIYTNAAGLLGLSPERVRQIVNVKIARGVSRRDAVLELLSERDDV